MMTLTLYYFNNKDYTLMEQKDKLLLKMTG